jgi:glutaminyl-peptide cyclotransferase
MALGHAANLTSVPVRLVLLLAALLVVLAGCGGSDDPADDGSFDSQAAFDDVRAQVEIGPRPSGSAGARREVALIAERFGQAGVRDVTVQRPYRNVVARIPGDGRGTVVVGAHYDTKDIPGFVGANDGASGVAVLLELARALPDRSSGASIDLVFFDAEEARGNRDFERDGDRGSRQFVAYAKRGGAHGSPPLSEIRSMVLFDMVGDCDLQIPREATSDPRLYGQFAAAAAELDGDAAPFEGFTGGVEDDHTPFQQAGVPAVDLIDFTYGSDTSPGPYWHTRQDTLDKVCASSLEEVGEAAVLALPRIAER